MLHDAIKRTPYMNALSAAETTGLSLPTVNTLLDGLRELGIVEEITGCKRDRMYLYRSMMTVLETANLLTA